MKKKTIYWILGIIVINIMLPRDKKLFSFDPINTGLTFPLFDNSTPIQDVNVQYDENIG